MTRTGHVVSPATGKMSPDALAGSCSRLAVRYGADPDLGLDHHLGTRGFTVKDYAANHAPNG